MDINLEKQLIEKYPKLFTEYNLSPLQTCMCFGLECGDGWFNIIDEMCLKLSKYDIKFTQVKEKFGALRVYFEGANIENYEPIFNIISEAEEKSAITCEICGKSGCLRGLSWYKTLCEDCHEQT